MKNKNSNTDLFLYILSMVIYGTVGLFKKYSALPSAFIAASRGFLGALLLFAVKRKINFKALKPILVLLIVSGALMGINWILLFESFNYTSVAVGTLCYYIAPVLVIAASPFVLKERLTAKGIISIIMAALGMILITGFGDYSAKGIILATSAAVLYAAVITINKFTSEADSIDKTVIQLLAAGLVVLPYSLLCEPLKAEIFTLKAILILLCICLLHTAIAYYLFFSTMKNLKAQTVAVCSYIDPLTAVLCSALLLGEPLTVKTIIGAVLILSTVFLS